MLFQKSSRIFLSGFGLCCFFLSSLGVIHAQSKPTTRPTQLQSLSKRAKPVKTSAPLPKVSHNDKIYKAILQTQQLLKRVMWKHGRDPSNPWLLAHTLLVFGKTLTLPGGQLAVDRIVSGFLKFKKMKGVEVPYFPAGSSRVRIEPHPSMHLKTFLELGIPLSRKFKVGKRTVTLQQMLDGVYKLFPSNPHGRQIGTQAWRFFLLYGRRPKNNQAWAWMNGKGEQVVFIRQVLRMMKYLDKNTSFLRIMKSRGVKVIPKLKLRRQHIYGESCGGFHLIQAAARWMSHPSLKKRLTPLLHAQIELMYYRLGGEVRLYTQLFKKYQKHAAYRFIILLQQLKFLGHFLETIADLYHWGLHTPTKKQRKQIRDAVRLTVVTVMLLSRLGWFERLEQLKARSHQLYLDLLGDSAHTTHALILIRDTGLYTP